MVRRGSTAGGGQALARKRQKADRTGCCSRRVTVLWAGVRNGVVAPIGKEFWRGQIPGRSHTVWNGDGTERWRPTEIAGGWPAQ
jgi:hypothetical protein